MISAAKIQKVLESYTHLQLFLYLCNQIRERIGPCVNSRKIAANQKPKIAETPMNTGFMKHSQVCLWF